MASRIKKKVLYRYTSIPSIIDLLRNEEIAILDPQQWDDRNDRHFMQVYKEKRGAKGLYALCAAMQPETYHHWRVFTREAGGACVVLKREPLEKYLTSLSNQAVAPMVAVRFDEVEYLKLPEVRKIGPADIDRMPFLKRYGFKDEAEFRIIIESSSEQEGAIYIDCPPEWIDRIYLNPWLPKQHVRSMIKTLEELSRSGSVDVRPSHLIDSATWKTAGNRVACKKSITKAKTVVQPKKDKDPA